MAPYCPQEHRAAMDQKRSPTFPSQSAGLGAWWLFLLTLSDSQPGAWGPTSVTLFYGYVRQALSV